MPEYFLTKKEPWQKQKSSDYAAHNQAEELQLHNIFHRDIPGIRSVVYM
jgi:hypothetical protein